MLSVPILVRDNFGGGYLRMAEKKEQGKRRLSLEFGAGSDPERAAWLNRLGVFEESIVSVGEQLESALYFGFMTTSTEKEVGEARTALDGKAATAFTASGSGPTSAPGSPTKPAPRSCAPPLLCAMLPAAPSCIP